MHVNNLPALYPGNQVQLQALQFYLSTTIGTKVLKNI